MTYSESARGKVISHARALQELEAHGVVDVEEFYREMGYRDTYRAVAVLHWLGY